MKLFNFKKEIQVLDGYKKDEDGFYIYDKKDKKISVYKTEEGINYTKIGIFCIISLFLIITIFASFKTVKSGEIGLRVRFGKIVDSKLTEGFNFKIPYVEKIVKVNIKTQKVELTTESSTKDMQTVQTILAVNFRVEKDQAVKLYKNVGNSYKDTILIPAIQESVKSAMSKYSAEEVITKRNEVSEECLRVLQSKVKKYGLTIQDFNIIDLSFSEAYKQAVEEKTIAEQKVLTAQQNLERARVENEQKVAEAEATRQVNELLNQTITEDILLKQFIEKWDGKLPETYAGNDLLSIFNIR